MHGVPVTGQRTCLNTSPVWRYKPRKGQFRDGLTSQLYDEEGINTATH